METKLRFVFTTIILLSPFILLLLIKAWSWKSKSVKSPKQHDKMPPSPPVLPIIGHLHHLVGSSLPHRTFYTMARKYGPVLHLRFGQVSSVLISSRDATKTLLKTQDSACADRPGSIASRILFYDNSDIFFSPYNEYWRQMRKICIIELLSAKNIKSFGSIRQDEVSRLIESLRCSSGKSINLTEKVNMLSSSIICRSAFGKVMRDRDVLLEMMRKVIALVTGFELADLFPSFKLLNFLSWNKYKILRINSKLDAIFDAVVEEHKLKPGGEFGGEDLVDALLRVQRCEQLEFPITNNNIKAIIYDIFNAGTDTASSTIVWAMAELMRNPHVMAKAQAEVREACRGKNVVEESDILGLKYVKFVIKETLRLHPPVPLLPRSCKDECTVNGYTIPHNSQVLFNIWSMGRDPEYWDEPESFIPERFENCSIDFLGKDFEFIPFGAGKRVCPGINFGLAIVGLVLTQLLYHFDWKMPRGMTCNDMDMTEEAGVTVAKKNDLYLVPTIHND